MIETFQEWELLFYTKPLLEIVLCIALVIAIRHRSKHSILKFIPIYITIFLVIFLLTEARTLSSPRQKIYVWINAVCEYIDYASIAVELFIIDQLTPYLTKKIPVWADGKNKIERTSKFALANVHSRFTN